VIGLTPYYPIARLDKLHQKWSGRVL